MTVEELSKDTKQPATNTGLAKEPEFWHRKTIN